MRIISCLLLLAIATPVFAAPTVTLTDTPWPKHAGKPCKPCLTLEIQEIRFQYPYAWIGRVAMLDGESPFLHVISPPPEDRSFSISILRFGEIRKMFASTGWFEKYHIKSMKHLLDVIGLDPEGDKNLVKLRKIYDIDKARRFSRTSRAPFTLYRLQFPEGGRDRVYIINDVVPEQYYVIEGDISDETYAMLLSRMRYRE